MVDYMVNFFVSFFENPSGSGIYLAISIGLAIAFGVVWLAGYRPPLFKKPWLWAVLVSSPFLALAGYGLARGRGWQFYPIASALHALLNYSVVLLQAGLFTIVHVEIYVALLAVLVTAWALWLRWRKSGAMADYEISSL